MGASDRARQSFLAPRAAGRLLALIAVTGLFGLNIGCSNRFAPSPYASGGEQPRNPERARALHSRATAVLDEDPDFAEKLLREALAADLYHGPAHNNLGVLLLAREELYAAATEFEWARKLMPGHPDPRVNLALTLERAGRFDEALKTYESALAVWENYLPALQGKARLQVATRTIDDSTEHALREIALRGQSDWRAWARQQLAEHSMP